MLVYLCIHVQSKNFFRSTIVIGVDFAFLGVSIAFGMIPVFNDFLKTSK